MRGGAAPLRKPSQRHSTLRGMDAHHLLRPLNPNASHLRATAAFLVECVYNCNNPTPSLLRTEPASLLQTVPEAGRGLTPATPDKEQNRVRERSADRRQSAGGVEREREWESRAHRLQSADDIGRERERESAGIEGGSSSSSCGTARQTVTDSVSKTKTRHNIVFEDTSNIHRKA